MVVLIVLALVLRIPKSLHFMHVQVVVSLLFDLARESVEAIDVLTRVVWAYLANPGLRLSGAAQIRN